MAAPTLITYLGLNTASFFSQMGLAQTRVQQFSSQMQTSLGRGIVQFDTMTEKLSQFQPLLLSAGIGFTAMGAAISLALGVAIKSAIEYERAFAGVRKTVDGTEPELRAISQAFRDMSKAIPVASTELAHIGEIAGSMGVSGVENVKKFTEVVAKMGATTNLTSEAAATAFAQIANVMQEPIANVDRMASSIVQVGQKFVTTEAQVTEFTVRIAGAGKIAGLTTAEIIGIAGAFASVGIQAELGGTAIQRVLTEMTKAVATGSGQLDVFAAVAGHTNEEFQKLFRTKPAEAFTQVVEGFNRAGQKSIQIFEALGLDGQRTFLAFQNLANAGQLLRKAIDESKNAWEKNTAAQKAFSERAQTTHAQLTLLWNRITDLGITIGNAFLPAIKAVSTAIGLMVNALNNIPGIGILLAVIGSLTAALLLSVGAITLWIAWIVATRVPISAMLLKLWDWAGGLKAVSAAQIAANAANARASLLVTANGTAVAAAATKTSLLTSAWTSLGAAGAALSTRFGTIGTAIGTFASRLGLAQIGSTTLATALRLIPNALSLIPAALRLIPATLGFLTGPAGWIATIALFTDKLLFGGRIWKDFTEVLSMGWEKIKSGASTAGASIGNFTEKILGVGDTIGDFVGGMFVRLGEEIEDVQTYTEGAYDAFDKWYAKFTAANWSFLTDAIHGVASAQKSLFEVLEESAASNAAVQWVREWAVELNKLEDWFIDTFLDTVTKVGNTLYSALQPKRRSQISGQDWAIEDEAMRAAERSTGVTVGRRPLPLSDVDYKRATDAVNNARTQWANTIVEQSARAKVSLEGMWQSEERILAEERTALTQSRTKFGEYYAARMNLAQVAGDKRLDEEAALNKERLSALHQFNMQEIALDSQAKKLKLQRAKESSDAVVALLEIERKAEEAYVAEVGKLYAERKALTIELEQARTTDLYEQLALRTQAQELAFDKDRTAQKKMLDDSKMSTDQINDLILVFEENISRRRQKAQSEIAKDVVADWKTFFEAQMTEVERFEESMVEIIRNVNRMQDTGKLTLLGRTWDEQAQRDIGKALGIDKLEQDLKIATSSLGQLGDEAMRAELKTKLLSAAITLGIRDEGVTAFEAMIERLIELRAEMEKTKDKSALMYKGMSASQAEHVAATLREDRKRLAATQDATKALEEYNKREETNFNASMEWTAQETRSKGEFFKFLGAEFALALNKSTDLWEASALAVRDFVTDATKSLRTFIYDFFKNGTLDMKKLWQGVLDAMLNALSDWVVSAIKAFGSAFLFGGSGGAGGGGGGIVGALGGSAAAAVGGSATTGILGGLFKSGTEGIGGFLKGLFGDKSTTAPNISYDLAQPYSLSTQYKGSPEFAMPGEYTFTYTPSPSLPSDFDFTSLELAKGGVVPGTRGEPVVATVHGGEVVIPVDALSDPLTFLRKLPAIMARDPREPREYRGETYGLTFNGGGVVPGEDDTALRVLAKGGEVIIPALVKPTLTKIAQSWWNTGGSLNWDALSLEGLGGTLGSINLASTLASGLTGAGIGLLLALPGLLGDPTTSTILSGIAGTAGLPLIAMATGAVGGVVAGTGAAAGAAAGLAALSTTFAAVTAGVGTILAAVAMWAMADTGTYDATRVYEQKVLNIRLPSISTLIDAARTERDLDWVMEQTGFQHWGGDYYNIPAHLDFLEEERYLSGLVKDQRALIRSGKAGFPGFNPFDAREELEQLGVADPLGKIREGATLGLINPFDSMRLLRDYNIIGPEEVIRGLRPETKWVTQYDLTGAATGVEQRTTIPLEGYLNEWVWKNALLQPVEAGGIYTVGTDEILKNVQTASAGLGLTTLGGGEIREAVATYNQLQAEGTNPFIGTNAAGGWVPYEPNAGPAQFDNLAHVTDAGVQLQQMAEVLALSPYGEGQPYYYDAATALAGFSAARGGLVPGSAPYTDRVPAMLTPGELVVRREVVPEAVAAMRASGVQFMAGGGSVGWNSGYDAAGNSIFFSNLTGPRTYPVEGVAPVIPTPVPTVSSTADRMFDVEETSQTAPEADAAAEERRELTELFRSRIDGGGNTYYITVHVGAGTSSEVARDTVKKIQEEIERRSLRVVQTPGVRRG